MTLWGSRHPSSTARRKGVPWAIFSPSIVSLVSEWASMWTIPTGPYRSWNYKTNVDHSHGTLNTAPGKKIVYNSSLETLGTFVFAKHSSKFISSIYLCERCMAENRVIFLSGLCTCVYITVPVRQTDSSWTHWPSWPVVSDSWSCGLLPGSKVCTHHWSTSGNVYVCPHRLLEDCKG